jgi:hypothetical protein
MIVTKGRRVATVGTVSFPLESMIVTVTATEPGLVAGVLTTQLKN